MNSPSIKTVKKITTASGREVEFKCPICENHEFASSGPADDDQRRGFTHVITGVGSDGSGLYQPVRFFACNDCGFIMKFLLPAEKEGEQ